MSETATHTAILTGHHAFDLPALTRLFRELPLFASGRQSHRRWQVSSKYQHILGCVNSGCTGCASEIIGYYQARHHWPCEGWSD